MPKKTHADREAATRKKAAELGLQLPDDLHGDALTEWLMQQITALIKTNPLRRRAAGAARKTS